MEPTGPRPGPGLPGDEDGLLAADAGDLVRLDADGRESWRSPGAVVRHEHDGRLVVETAEGAAAVVDADTGETQRELDGGFVGADDDLVLVTADGDGVRLVGLDGSERWVRRPAEVDVSSGVAALFTTACSPSVRPVPCPRSSAWTSTTVTSCGGPSRASAAR